MPKTIRSMLHDSEIRQQYWLDVADDTIGLKDLNKTRDQAMMLSNYFEGKADGFRESLYLKKEG